MALTIGNLKPCPKCTWMALRWFASASLDANDVEPHGYCTNPDCDWEIP